MIHRALLGSCVQRTNLDHLILLFFPRQIFLADIFNLLLLLGRVGHFEAVLIFHVIPPKI